MEYHGTEYIWKLVQFDNWKVKFLTFTKQSPNMLALRHHGLVPTWCRARLKIVAQQQLEHHRSLWSQLYVPKSRKVEGERITVGKERLGKKGTEYTLLASISYHFTFLVFFPAPPSYSPPPTPTAHHSPMPMKGRDREWAAIQGRKERKKLVLWGRLDSETLPSPTLKSHLILPSSQSSHWSFQSSALPRSRENIRQKLHRW